MELMMAIGRMAVLAVTAYLVVLSLFGLVLVFYADLRRPKAEPG